MPSEVVVVVSASVVCRAGQRSVFIVSTGRPALGLAWRQDKTSLVSDETGSKSREYQDSDTGEENGNDVNSVCSLSAIRG